MRIKIDEVIKTLDGEPYTDEKGAPLTLKTVIKTILSAPLPGSYEEKIERALLARRVNIEGSVVEISTEEASLIKPLVAAIYNPIIVLAVKELFESATNE